VALKDTVKKGYYEWFILFFLTGNVPGYSVYIYTINNYVDFRLLVVAVFSLLLCLIAAAKANICNVFKVVRATPKAISSLFKYIIDDYKYWRIHGRRFIDPKYPN
jgi:hypothetical protein